jgi:superoxide dismutase, Cu-Zn family
MRRRATVVAGLGLATILTLGTGSVLAFGFGGVGSSAETKLRAEAVIEGAPGSGIVGTVTFVQTGGEEDQPTPAVRLQAKVSGLSPGLHGFHLHENGACAPAYTAAGGHYDPGPSGNPDPDANHPYHMGDLPNLVVGPSGVGRLDAVTTRATLSPGPTTLFDANGSAVIVHLNPDQGITGPTGSGVSGGPRVACGVIEMG